MENKAKRRLTSTTNPKPNSFLICEANCWHAISYLESKVTVTTKSVIPFSPAKMKQASKKRTRTCRKRPLAQHMYIPHCKHALEGIHLLSFCLLAFLMFIESISQIAACGLPFIGFQSNNHSRPVAESLSRI